ncbi:MAG: aspartate-semialdehyde dehydrogenase [Oscillospiraceae bacterium]|jgi:aspartate-semialdehyde dehydrogenase|nr:aspartate-semialdehyde dehydrogenase [Oscillospiraceae bacterium]
MKKYKVGIVGATGMVGKNFANLLKDHPFFDLTVVAASSKSASKTYREALDIKFGKTEKIPERFHNLLVLDAQKDVKKISSLVDFVFCAIDMEKYKLKKLEEAYAKSECPVISNNSANRWTSDVPMIIPEINSDHSRVIHSQRKRIKTKRGFIAVKPNCSLQCYVPTLHPLLNFKITKVLVCTYQSISGAGKVFNSWPEMIDNVIPYIPDEEEKTEKEPLKIWGKIKNGKIINSKNPSITSQCIRIPVSFGHTSAVFVSFKNKPSLNEILERWKFFKGEAQNLDLPSAPKQFIKYFDDPYRPQINDVRKTEQSMAILTGRLREDKQYDYKFICMSHNTVRGAAGGGILMAELLSKQGFFD